MWARLFGDALDIALIATGFFYSRSRRGRLTAALSAVAGISAIDIYAARRVKQERDELYQSWRVTPPPQ